MMNNFVWVATSSEKHCLEYLVLHKHVSAVLKVCVKLATLIAKLAMFSVNSSILISLYEALVIHTQL